MVRSSAIRPRFNPDAHTDPHAVAVGASEQPLEEELEVIAVSQTCSLLRMIAGSTLEVEGVPTFEQEMREMNVLDEWKLVVRARKIRRRNGGRQKCFQVPARIKGHKCLKVARSEVTVAAGVGHERSR